MAAPLYADGKILMIRTTFHNVQCSTLLDTGAGAILVGKPWLDAAKNIVWERNFSVEGAKAGEALTVLGTVQGVLEIGGRNIKISAIATPDLNRHLILSWRLLKSLGTSF